MPTINVLSKNKKNITFSHLKIIVFTVVKNCSILHGRVSVLSLANSCASAHSDSVFCCL